MFAKASWQLATFKSEPNIRALHCALTAPSSAGSEMVAFKSCSVSASLIVVFEDRMISEPFVVKTWLFKDWKGCKTAAEMADANNKISRQNIMLQ